MHGWGGRNDVRIRRGITFDIETTDKTQLICPVMTRRKARVHCWYC